MRARGVSRVKVVAVAAVLIALLVIPTISSSINIYAIKIDNNNSNSNITNADTYNKEAIANKLLNTRISLPFIANVGQYDDSNIKYYADTFVGRVLIYDDNNEIVYLLKDNVIKERLIITSTVDNTTSTDSIILKGNDPSITKVNYFKANKVLTDIPTYNSISFVSNSIELILKAYNNNIEKVFVVKPYADVNDIVMEVDNSSISIDNDGRLIIDDIVFTKPIAYQIIDGKKVNVDVSYKIIADNRYGFSVGNYDNRYDLIIDPLLDLSASTYIGGSYGVYDVAEAIAIDSNNNVFITGYTDNNDFPIVNGYDDSHNGGADAFVAKFNNNLDQLLASTYIGGSYGDDIAYAIAIDSNNNVFITGGTYSNDFPIVNGYDDSNNGLGDAFVAKFNNDLDQLLASTYIGGSYGDAAWAIAIDRNNNNVFITGVTYSNDFPIVNGYDDSYNGGLDAFVAKFNNDLDQLLASTYIGGSYDGDIAYAIAIDSNNNNVFIAGYTGSNNFPIKDGYDNSYNGNIDAFVAKFNNNLDQLLASTYIGGSDYEYAEAIAIDSNNNVFITGYTWSYDFPIVNGYDDSHNGYTDAFVAKFNNDLDQLLASTYIGGSDYDAAEEIAIDSNNNVFITGYTYSNDFPIVNGYDNSYNGNIDAFVAKFNNDLDQLLASTYIGGIYGGDVALAIAIDSNNNVFITGGTWSYDFPIVNGYDDSYNGDVVDAFVAKLTSIEQTYNLELYEDSNPSDGVINLGEDITATATTNDSSVVNVTFIWIDPSNNVAWTNTVNIVNGEASDTFTPNQVGTWQVIAQFSNGTIVVIELNVSFQVVPESIIGALSVIGSSLAVLAVYRRRRKVNNN
jgi:hypothetical protein